jgi:hypothetical protein
MIIATKSFHLSLEDLTRLVQITAIIVGAIAAYIKWFTNQARLEISVVGSLVEASPSQLLATIRVKNVGTSKVPIKQEGSGLRIFSAMPTKSIPYMLSVEWKHEGTFPVFQEHERIEIGETIEDQLFVTLPEGRPGAYRLELWLASGRIVWKSAIIANVEAVH